MAPDIELHELTVGGLLEPKAEWTAAARGHVANALATELRSRDATLVEYRPPVDDRAREHAHEQLIKLNDAVSGAVLVHQYVPRFKLPTKNDRFDWSLGPQVRILRDEYGADYALFIYLRDSYASAGRAVLVVGAALLGVAMPSGRQVGIASLVDLRTGDVVWFNRVLDPGGDLRTPEPAQRAVKKLLGDCPL
jgi:hypothetical protein